MGLEVHAVTDVDAWMAENAPAGVRRSLSPPSVADGAGGAMPAEPGESVVIGPVVVPLLSGLESEASAIQPMRCARTPGELVSAARATLTREVHDVRYEALVRGVRAAEDWVHGFSDTSPIRRELVPSPSLRQIVDEYGHALMVSAGARPYPGRGLSDLARVLAHGSELYLLWYAFAEAPRPAVLDPRAQLRDIFEDLADVGFDVMGLHGPEVSRLPFGELPGSPFLVRNGALVIR